MSNKSKFILAAITMVVIIIVNQSFIQYWLYKKHSDAELINISGRQRMLSQRILLAAEYNNEKEFEELTRIWWEVHQLLLNGSVDQDISPVEDQDIREQLDKLEPYIEFALHFDLNSDDSIEELRNNQVLFLNGMEEVVAALEKDSSDKLGFIVRTEIILALLSLLIVILELWCIYLPINKSLHRGLIRNKELFYEYNHRMKNNLTMIHNLLMLKKISSKDENLNAFIRDTQNRIKSIADTTEMLEYDKGREQIDTSHYIEKLVEDLKRTYLQYPDKYLINYKLENIELNFREIQVVGLIVNELVTNIFKYAYDPEVGGRIDISLELKNSKVHLRIRDYGVGVGENASSKSGLGTRLIEAMLVDLNADMTKKVEGGLSYSIEFQHNL